MVATAGWPAPAAVRAAAGTAAGDAAERDVTGSGDGRRWRCQLGRPLPVAHSCRCTAAAPPERLASLNPCDSTPS